MKSLTRVPRRRVRSRRSFDERGVEAPAMIIVIPVLVILVLALIDVGFSLRTRMLVENVARDTARGVAADGGNLNPRTKDALLPAGGWEAAAMSQLWRNGECVLSGCERRPTVNCTPDVASQAGVIVECTVEYYPTAINKSLLDSPLGLGMGSLIPDRFSISAQARAETGGG